VPRCGHGGLGRGACGRAPRRIQSYQSRVSGPLLDRIDLRIDLPPVTAADLGPPPPAEGSAETAARGAQARALQVDRAEAADDAGAALNARAQGAWLDRIAALDDPARALLSRAAEAGGLTARGWSRTLRLARTIADLEGATGVRRVHVAEALIYRGAGLGAGMDDGVAQYGAAKQRQTGALR
jgi:magnesium chelatase family protein